MEKDKSYYISVFEKENYIIETKQEFIIDALKPEDALNVSRCYYQVYGKNHPFEAAYVPEELLRLHSSGSQLTAVARTRKGDILGLSSIYRSAPGRNIYEIGAIMVVPSYRNSKVAFKIMNYLITELLPKVKAEIFFGECVCNHTITQKMGKKYYNSMDYAFKFDALPVRANPDDEAVTGYISLLLMFFFRENRTQKIFLPECYSEYCRYLYSPDNLSREIIWNDYTLQEDDTRYTINSYEHICAITINSIGRDFKEILSGNSQDKNTHSVYVYLDLSKPGINQAVNHLRKNGFFFGGILPGWFDTDGLLMQKISGKPDFDSLQLFTENAKKILQFSLADWQEVSTQHI